MIAAREALKTWRKRCCQGALCGFHQARETAELIAPDCMGFVRLSCWNRDPDYTFLFLRESTGKFTLTSRGSFRTISSAQHVAEHGGAYWLLDEIAIIMGELRSPEFFATVA